MKLHVRFVFIIVVTILCTPGLTAQGYLSIDGGLTFIGNADPDSAISPVVPGSGISVPFFLTPHLFIKSAIFFTGTNYLYNGTRPVPAEIEHREYLVLFPELDCFFGINLPITRQLEWGANGGLALLFRFPIALFASETENYTNVANWFYASMRFLYPGVELYLKWNIEENFGLIISGKSLIPVYHLWDNEGSPFWDQLLVSGTISLFFALPADKSGK